MIHVCNLCTVKDREDEEFSLSFSQAWMYSHTVFWDLLVKEENVNYIGEPPAHIQGRLQSLFVCSKLPRRLCLKIVGNAKVTQNNLTGYFSQRVICNVTGILFNGNSDVI